VIPVLLLAFSGVGGLCLAMARHQPAALGRSATPRESALLRAGGIVGLGASFGAAGAGSGWDVGAVAWCGAVMTAALALTLVASYRPRWIPGLAARG
jgi:hypothetical protein